MSISGLIRSVQLVVDFDVEVALILCVGFVCEIACHTLTFLDCKDFAKIENGLLPMRVFGMRTGREPNRFVTRGKVDIEPGDEGMNEIVSLATEAEGSGKGEFGGCDSVEVDGENRTWIRDEGFQFDCIY